MECSLGWDRGLVYLPVMVEVQQEMAIGISACSVGEGAIGHGDQSIFIVRVGQGRILGVVVVVVDNLSEVFESSINTVDIVYCFLTEGIVSTVSPTGVHFLERSTSTLERERKQEK